MMLLIDTLVQKEKVYSSWYSWAWTIYEKYGYCPSTASMAIILIDVRKDILSQTRRHAFIASLLGIKHIVLAINKFDLVDYEVKVFENLKNNFKAVSDYLNFKSLQFIPISALNGDNVIVKSNNMPWYEGPSLLQYLENFKLENNTNDPLRVPIQYVIREGQDFRGYGRIVSGQMRKNQRKFFHQVWN